MTDHSEYSPFSLDSATTTTGFDRTDAGSESLRSMAAEELLEEALETNAEDPAHYISTMMPSRQAARCSWGYGATGRCRLSRSYSRKSRRHTSSRRLVRPNVRLRTRSELCDSATFDLIQGVIGDDVFDEGQEDDEVDEEDYDELKILMDIKGMVASMAVKRTERDRLIKGQKRLTSKSPAWKLKLKKDWEHFMERMQSLYSVGFIWRNALRNIEGHYGTSVAAVFVFIQWLFLINILVFILVLIFIVIPPVVYGVKEEANAINCSITTVSIGLFQDLIQGTGWMTCTEMYYGYYMYNHNGTFVEKGDEFTYNLPLAYLMVTIVYFALCLILMLRNAAKGSRENLFTSKGRVNECSNIIFGGWDYCVSKEKKAGLRHEIIYNELMGIINEEKMLERKRRRTERDRLILFSIRVLINTVVVLLLGGCGYLIFFVVFKSQEWLDKSDPSASSGDVLKLIIEFMPSLVITALNIFVPLVFYKLVEYERYSPASVINVTLVRTVFLKLASIAVLLVTLYKGVAGDWEINCRQCITCWETYVGQQIYKLAIMDFATGVLITFIIHFPRMLIATRVPNWIGRQQFDIPTNVLDIVYSQTLCWLGTFYSPLLPVLNVMKCFIFFYVKEFSLFINCEPSRLTYRASKSNTLFTIVLLLSFVLAIIPVAYSIGEIGPSKNCGPFMGLNRMWDVIPQTMSSWPSVAQNVVHYFGTAGFAVPVVIVLVLIIYFYTTMSSAHKHEIQLLQEQLLMEGRDKQYLLNRLRHVLAYRQSWIAQS